MSGIDTGEMDRHITILRAGDVDDGFATVPGAYVEIGGRPARKTDASDGERVRAAEQGQSLTSRFGVRHDPLTVTITGRDRIVCEGVTYDVTGTKEWRGRRVGIEITATARPDTRP